MFTIKMSGVVPGEDDDDNDDADDDGDDVDDDDDDGWYRVVLGEVVKTKKARKS